MGNLTLTRFFTLHGFVLPGTVILLVVIHLYLFRVHGVTPSWWESASQLKAGEEPFWPKQALKDGLLALVFLLALGLGYMYQQTHRVLPCIAVHMLLNSCSLVM